MQVTDVLMVKIYITEASHMLDKIISYLRKEAGIRGVSVFRAVSGFGESGIHTAYLVDSSLDLPLTIEFFDTKEKVNLALEHLATMVKSEHIVVWEAKANL